MEALPGGERAGYRQVVGDTFDILQQAISLPCNRLTKLMAVKDQAKFADELEGLADLPGWAKLEKAAFLCEPLRACGREMDGLLDNLKGRLTTRDWKRLRELVERLLGGEPEFAHLISSSLRRLSEMAARSTDVARGLPQSASCGRANRDGLQDLRRRLLTKQVEFYDVI